LRMGQKVRIFGVLIEDGVFEAKEILPWMPTKGQFNQMQRPGERKLLEERIREYKEFRNN